MTLSAHAVRAVVIADGSLKVQQREIAEPVGDQVLVEVAGAGVNRADLLQRAGRHPAPPGWPFDVPGLEFAGTVVAAGPAVKALRVGTKVLGIVGGGAQASHVLTPERLCAVLPGGLDPVAAGGVPEVFVTAYDALAQADLRPGERVLVHATGSGVGTAAVQLVRALGAVSVGTSRSPAKLERASELGLNAAVLAGPNMVRRIGEVDVVLDLVGGEYVGIDLQVCRPRGRVVVVGLTGGGGAHVDLSLLLRRRLHVIGTVLRARPDHEKAAAMAAFRQRVLPLFERGLLRPVIDRVLPLEAAEEAYAAVAANSVFGKLVLSPAATSARF